MLCYATHFRTLAGIICDSGAASIVDCHVFVVFGPTQPISKNHSSRIRPLNRTCENNESALKRSTHATFCLGELCPVLPLHKQQHQVCTFWSSRNFSIDSTVLKLISLDTARRSSILTGTLASCSTPDDEKSLFSCQMTLPVSASRNIIQLLKQREPHLWNETHNINKTTKNNSPSETL